MENEQTISIDDFFKAVLKIGVVKECKPVKRSEKLFELLVDIGGVERTILSGLVGSYTADELLGKQVVVVTNLEPRKICGIQSNGMIVAASDATDNDKAVLLVPEKPVPSGSSID